MARSNYFRLVIGISGAVMAGAAAFGGVASASGLINFTSEFYSVSYVDEEGNVLLEKKVKKGENVYFDLSSIPQKEATNEWTYTFSKWSNNTTDGKVENVEEDTVVVAVFNKKATTLTYTFMSGDVELWSYEGTYNSKFEFGDKIVIYRGPKVEGYQFIFDGWDADCDGFSDYTNDTLPKKFLSNQIFYAIFRAIPVEHSIELKAVVGINTDSIGEISENTYPEINNAIKVATREQWPVQVEANKIFEAKPNIELKFKSISNESQLKDAINSVSFEMPFYGQVGLDYDTLSPGTKEYLRSSLIKSSSENGAIFDVIYSKTVYDGESASYDFLNSIEVDSYLDADGYEYNFVGWSTDGDSVAELVKTESGWKDSTGNPLDLSTRIIPNVSNNFILTAVYSKTGEQFSVNSVKFVSNGDNFGNVQYLKPNDSIPFPSEKPSIGEQTMFEYDENGNKIRDEKTGEYKEKRYTYEFLGWDLNGDGEVDVEIDNNGEPKYVNEELSNLKVGDLTDPIQAVYRFKTSSIMATVENESFPGLEYKFEFEDDEVVDLSYYDYDLDKEVHLTDKEDIDKKIDDISKTICENIHYKEEVYSFQNGGVKVDGILTYLYNENTGEFCETPTSLKINDQIITDKEEIKEYINSHENTFKSSEEMLAVYKYLKDEEGNTYSSIYDIDRSEDFTLVPVYGDKNYLNSLANTDGFIESGLGNGNQTTGSSIIPGGVGDFDGIIGGGGQDTAQDNPVLVFKYECEDEIVNNERLYFRSKSSATYNSELHKFQYGSEYPYNEINITKHDYYVKISQVALPYMRGDVIYDYYAILTNSANNSYEYIKLTKDSFSDLYYFDTDISQPYIAFAEVIRGEEIDYNSLMSINSYRPVTDFVPISKTNNLYVVSDDLNVTAYNSSLLNLEDGQTYHLDNFYNPSLTNPLYYTFFNNKISSPSNLYTLKNIKMNASFNIIPTANYASPYSPPYTSIDLYEPYFTVNNILPSNKQSDNYLNYKSDSYDAYFYNVESVESLNALYSATKSLLIQSVDLYRRQCAYAKYVYQNYLGISGFEGFYDTYSELAGISESDSNITKVIKVKNYLQNKDNYLYSMDYINSSSFLSKGDQDILKWFMENGTEGGICNMFAGNATLWLRSLGVPTRFVEGYVSDCRNNVVNVVTSKDAHAWIEVYFDDIGWIAIEVTGYQMDGESGFGGGGVNGSGNGGINPDLYSDVGFEKEYLYFGTPEVIKRDVEGKTKYIDQFDTTHNYDIDDRTLVNIKLDYKDANETFVYNGFGEKQYLSISAIKDKLELTHKAKLRNGDELKFEFEPLKDNGNNVYSTLFSEDGKFDFDDEYKSYSEYQIFTNTKGYLLLPGANMFRIKVWVEDRTGANVTKNYHIVMSKEDACIYVDRPSLDIDVLGYYETTKKEETSYVESIIHYNNAQYKLNLTSILEVELNSTDKLSIVPEGYEKAYNSCEYNFIKFQIVFDFASFTKFGVELIPEQIQNIIDNKNRIELNYKTSKSENKEWVTQSGKYVLPNNILSSGFRSLEINGDTYKENVTNWYEWSENYSLYNLNSYYTRPLFNHYYETKYTIGKESLDAYIDPCETKDPNRKGEAELVITKAVNPPAEEVYYSINEQGFSFADFYDCNVANNSSLHLEVNWSDMDASKVGSQPLEAEILILDSNNNDVTSLYKLTQTSTIENFKISKAKIIITIPSTQKIECGRNDSIVIGKWEYLDQIGNVKSGGDIVYGQTSISLYGKIFEISGWPINKDDIVDGKWYSITLNLKYDFKLFETAGKYSIKLRVTFID